MGRMTSATPCMPSQPSISTRASLLARLRSDDSVEGWEEFYQVYGALLRRFALKGGLTEAEAEEVVQETAIGVARNLPGFRYDPAGCSFKTWMLNLAQWRITDALRRRRTSEVRTESEAFPGHGAPAGDPDPSSATPLIERVPDPHPPDFGSEWDAAWECQLREVALGRVRQTVDPRHFQIFDLYALKERPAREVAARLGVSVACVYVVKQRLQSRLRKELQRLVRRATEPGNATPS